MVGFNKNVTVSLPVELINRIKAMSEAGYISSINASVRQALEEYLTALEKEQLRMIMSEAAKDELFINDLSESMKDFQQFEAGEDVPEW